MDSEAKTEDLEKHKVAFRLCSIHTEKLQEGFKQQTDMFRFTVGETKIFRRLTAVQEEQGNTEVQSSPGLPGKIMGTPERGNKSHGNPSKLI